VYALTDMMDRNQYAIVWEIIKSGFGISFLYRQDDWFGASTYLSAAKYILLAYFIISMAVTAWFVYLHYKEDKQLSIA
jgi:alkylglycerol monooxygenase